QVLPFSTGVIGEPLPADKIQAVIPQAVSQLDKNNWGEAARAIMTTDTLPKGVSTRLQMDGREVTITGIAKGSGMIRPDMATMLAFVATDAGLDRTLLQGCLSSAVDQSFNRITVDGDTSTNDACMLLATGQSGVQITANSRGYDDFIEALNSLCRQLAQAIIRDGEGVTKFISVCVEQGADTQECLDVAYTVAHSPLVKTAFFASDPNWGRILAAVGRAGVNGLVIEDVSLYLNGVCIVEQGARSASYTEEQGQAVMNEEEILVRICLGRGGASETVWTTDLSHEYVTINAEYRT
ncbi:MAG TPA: bifunctional glutamate N-acetyltransferase/amino-acid acetyltransferase ArgJ, partial [Gammaproteobacteria bacterium]|nr:bifunctional glutamate N-acetyltransferase/amino-acid acetyltransferase ArgJ [Gammaproteobacteria bacterium]